jgi:hypothetical protein
MVTVISTTILSDSITYIRLIFLNATKHHFRKGVVYQRINNFNT